MSALIAHLAAAERHLVDALELQPGAASTIACAWRGAPAHLEARAYHGPRVRHARVVTLRSAALEIANLLVLPALDHPLPILGVELVDLGRGDALAVADLSPVLPDTDLSPWAQGAPDRAALPSAGALPAWCARWFSPHALFARAPAVAAGPAVAQAAHAFAALAARGAAQPARRAEITAAQAAYCRDHLDHDRGLHLLHKLIGAPAADTFLRDVMFPLPSSLDRRAP